MLLEVKINFCDIPLESNIVAGGKNKMCDHDINQRFIYYF